MTEVNTLGMASGKTLEIEEDLKISLSYHFLEAERLTKTFKYNYLKYPVSIYLGETVTLSPKSAFIPFMVTLETKPDFFSFKIKGEIFLEGSWGTIEHLILSEDGEPPKIWSRIYHEILKVIKKLAVYLKVPLPRELEVE